MSDKWYTIEITEHELKSYKAKTWERVSDKGNEKDSGPTYGYAYSDATRVVDTEIYKQNVGDTFDLTLVIKAVNGL